MTYVHLCVSTYVHNICCTYVLLQKKLPSNALATGLAEGGLALGQESLLGYDRHVVSNQPLVCYFYT